MKAVRTCTRLNRSFRLRSTFVSGGRFSAANVFHKSIFFHPLRSFIAFKMVSNLYVYVAVCYAPQRFLLLFHMKISSFPHNIRRTLRNTARFIATFLTSIFISCLYDVVVPAVFRCLDVFCIFQFSRLFVNKCILLGETFHITNV